MSPELELQAGLFSVRALAFLVLTLWCVQRVGGGRWAALGAAGAGLLAVAFGLEAAATVETVLRDDSLIVRHLLIRPHAFSVLLAAQAVGALLLVLAFVDSRRVPTPRESIYGPPQTR